MPRLRAILPAALSALLACAPLPPPDPIPVVGKIARSDVIGCYAVYDSAWVPLSGESFVGAAPLIRLDTVRLDDHGKWKAPMQWWTDPGGELLTIQFWLGRSGSQGIFITPTPLADTLSGQVTGYWDAGPSKTSTKAYAVRNACT